MEGAGERIEGGAAPRHEGHLALETLYYALYYTMAMS